MGNYRHSNETNPAVGLRRGARAVSSVNNALQRDILKKRLQDALKLDRDALIKGGAHPTAVPEVTPNMSAVDMVKLQARYKILKGANPVTAHQQPNAPVTAPASKAVPGAVNTAGQPISTESNPMAVNYKGEPIAPVATGPLGAVAEPPARGPQDWMKEGMQKFPFQGGGTLPADADYQMTPDGRHMVTVQSEGGPTKVAFNPTFDQLMHGRTEGQYHGWAPEKKAEFLRANFPHPQVDGITTNPGATPFDINGKRAIRTPDPGMPDAPLTSNGPGYKDAAPLNATEYDPAHDRAIPRVGNTITSKYGTASVTSAPPAPAGPLAGLSTPPAGAPPGQIANNGGTGDVTTPLGSTSTKQDVTAAFAVNPREAEFKKRLMYPGDAVA